MSQRGVTSHKPRFSLTPGNDPPDSVALRPELDVSLFRKEITREVLLPISAVISEIWASRAAPRKRTVREGMMEKGYAFRVGRPCWATPFPQQGVQRSTSEIGSVKSMLSSNRSPDKKDGDTAKAQQEETDGRHKLYEERALAIEHP